MSAATLLVCFVPIPCGYLWALFITPFIAATEQYGLTYSGLALIEATPAVLLVQRKVIFGLLIAAILRGEKPNMRQLFGIGVALVGFAIILGAPALNKQILSISLVLSGSLLFALGQVLIRRLDGALTFFQLTAWIGVMAGLQMLLASWIIDGNPMPHVLATPIEA